MAIVDKELLLSYFETGDMPTQAQFKDLIDSCYNRKVEYLTQTEYNALVEAGTVQPDVEYNIYEQ